MNALAALLPGQPATAVAREHQIGDDPMQAIFAALLSACTVAPPIPVTQPAVGAAATEAGSDLTPQIEVTPPAAAPPAQMPPDPRDPGAQLPARMAIRRPAPRVAAQLPSVSPAQRPARVPPIERRVAAPASHDAPVAAAIPGAPASQPVPLAMAAVPEEASVSVRQTAPAESPVTEPVTLQCHVQQAPGSVATPAGPEQFTQATADRAAVTVTPQMTRPVRGKVVEAPQAAERFDPTPLRSSERGDLPVQSASRQTTAGTLPTDAPAVVDHAAPAVDAQVPQRSSNRDVAPAPGAVGEGKLPASPTEQYIPVSPAPAPPPATAPTTDPHTLAAGPPEAAARAQIAVSRQDVRIPQMRAQDAEAAAEAPAPVKVAADDPQASRSAAIIVTGEASPEEPAMHHDQSSRSPAPRPQGADAEVLPQPRATQIASGEASAPNVLPPAPAQVRQGDPKAPAQSATPTPPESVAPEQPQRLVMAVDRPELGRCELELSLQEGRVETLIVAERPETVTAIRSVEQQVRDALADQELTVAQFDVRQGPGRHAGEQQRRPDAQAAQRLSTISGRQVTPSTSTTGFTGSRLDLVA